MGLFVNATLSHHLGFSLIKLPKCLLLLFHQAILLKAMFALFKNKNFQNKSKRNFFSLVTPVVKWATTFTYISTDNYTNIKVSLSDKYHKTIVGNTEYKIALKLGLWFPCEIIAHIYMAYVFIWQPLESPFRSDGMSFNLYTTIGKLEPTN